MRAIGSQPSRPALQPSASSRFSPLPCPPCRTSAQIAQQLEVMAAALTVGADNSPEATITGSALTDQAVRLVDLASDVLLHPSFPDDEIARFKQRTRAGLVQQRANPGFLAAE